ncbi:hypothetical protein IQ07DRAFT_637604 [Pyrenochaeta sp. DS3sAY3a]|nr:hypothetical protein IQ07DRAFT_637604 [Pyrenochaeta sp. DS3sAY3a]
METTKGKFAQNVKRGKSVLESPGPAPPTSVKLDTTTKLVSPGKTQAKKNKKRRNEGEKSRDGDSGSSQVLVTKDNRRGSANLKNNTGQIVVGLPDQSGILLTKDSKLLPLHDSTDAAALKQMLEECYSSLENLTNVLAVIDETWQKQHSNTTAVIEKFMSHIAKR